LISKEKKHSKFNKFCFVGSKLQSKKHAHDLVKGFLAVQKTEQWDSQLGRVTILSHPNKTNQNTYPNIKTCLNKENANLPFTQSVTTTNLHTSKGRIVMILLCRFK
jgi:hypothetical protein